MIFHTNPFSGFWLAAWSPEGTDTIHFNIGKNCVILNTCYNYNNDCTAQVVLRKRLL